MASANRVLRFPTTRKAAFRQPVARLDQLPENVVTIRSRRHVTEVEAPTIAANKTPELALIMAALSALALGNKEHRRLFMQVGWQLAAMRRGDPSDPALNSACDILDGIRGMV